jgi:hypothetical protein
VSGCGTYLRVYDKTEGFISCDPADEPRVDAAVGAYIDSGGRDRIIDVTLAEGVPYKLLASQVTAWFVSTPESRRKRVEMNANSDAELEGHAREFGIWEDEF